MLVSIYESFVPTMELIYGNITTSGFGEGVTGSPITVYGLGQCFSYLSAVDCQLCYAESRFKLPLCFPSNDSRIYLDSCFLRYAGQNFFDTAIDELGTFRCSNSSVTSSNLTLSKLTVKAEKYTGYYSVERTVASSGVTVYGMARCWRSLNAGGCRDCLESARSNISRCLPASDGKALNAGCFVRCSILPFYLSSSTASSGSPSNFFSPSDFCRGIS